MKQRGYLWVSLFSGLLLLVLLAYSLTLWGGVGLIRVNGMLRTAYIVLAALAIVTLGLVAVLNLGAYKKSALAKIIAPVVIVLTVITLVFNLGAIYYVGDFFDNLGDTPPRLMITEGAQASGAPRLAVVFQTRLANINNLRWGDNDGLIGTMTEAKPVTSHVFLLSGLQPDTEYWYRVNFGTVYSFFTPPPDGNFNFALVADVHFGDIDASTEQLSSMLAAINDPENEYRLLFSNGDLVDFGFRNGQWAEAFTTLSDTVARLPFTMVAGNHDTLFTGVNKYKNYASPPGLPLENGTQMWRRIDCGRVHFLVLDVEWSAETITPAQKAWLENELKSIPQDDWVFVMSHGFYYSSGYVSEGWKWYDNPETIEALTPLFEQYQVDAVFSGHNHQMEVLKHNGVTYIINGVFGGKIDPAPEYISPASLWYSVEQHAYIGVEINGETAEVSFHGADGSVIYQYTLNNN